MSLNIQTATGLLEIGGSVTEEKIISALGYEPADKEVETTVDNHIGNTNIHITSEERTLWDKDVEDLIAHKSDKTIHVTSAEKQAWNNKSDFSGSYADLIDAPNITENESGNMIIADENSNIIMQVDANGLATTNVSAKSININGEDLGARLDELESTSLPNILDNESGDLTISDEAGNAIMKVDSNGLETTSVTAKSAIINGVDIGIKLDENKNDIDEVGRNLSSHISDTISHITADERTLWNNKSDFSGDFNDLTNAPNISEDDSGEVIYADESGNVIARIGEAGLETTQVIADTLVASGTNVGAKLSSLDSILYPHVDNNNIHITDTERATWNAKSDFDGNYNSLTNKPTDLASTTYVNEQIAALVNSAPDKLNTLDELAAALGDDANFATTVTNSLAEKANQTSLDTHTTNTVAHITATERTQWNNKSDFSGDWNDLTNAPDIKEDNTGNLVIADNNGNIIFRSSPNGFETTTLTAQTVTVGDIDVETSIVELRESVAGKAASSHNHTITASASDDDVVVLTGSNGTNKVTYSASHATSGVTAGTYKSVTVNKYGHVTAGTNPTTLSGYGITDAAAKTHTHAISDITNLQTTLDSKAAKTHTHAISDITNLQTTLDSKAASSHSHTVSNISDLTATATELNYMDGVTSNVQTQLDGKASTSSLSNYYTKAEIDSLVLITVDDIDSICG